MYDQEALILQGCGGNLTEWVEGINGILSEEEILKDGFRFEEAYIFKNECQSYDSALAIIGDYVNITSVDDQSEDFDEGISMQ